jgi:mannose-1-phosphate guanylyltransferase/mannose-1-phosphate guanylyltransferase/mannose-6-phosphate isomerase
MFAFTASFIQKQFEALEADIAKGLACINSPSCLKDLYKNAPSLSFDYAIAEKCPSVVMVPASFTWLDVGGWDAYAALMEKTDSEVYSYQSSGCFVDSSLPVALCGVDDLIVSVRNGAVLIAKKGNVAENTEGMRDIVKRIKAAGRNEIL